MIHSFQFTVSFLVSSAETLCSSFVSVRFFNLQGLEGFQKNCFLGMTTTECNNWYENHPVFHSILAFSPLYFHSISQINNSLLVIVLAFIHFSPWALSAVSALKITHLETRADHKKAGLKIHISSSSIEPCPPCLATQRYRHVRMGLGDWTGQIPTFPGA